MSILMAVLRLKNTKPMADSLVDPRLDQLRRNRLRRYLGDVLTDQFFARIACHVRVGLIHLKQIAVCIESPEPVI